MNMDKLQIFNKNQIKNKQFAELDLRPGDTVRVHQKIKEEKKDRIQVFEGVVIAIKHGHGVNATFTVRKISDGVGVERIFPLHAPFIEKIEIIKRVKVRRAKLYYLRDLRGKKARLKQKKFESIIAEEGKPVVEQPESAGQSAGAPDKKSESDEAKKDISKQGTTTVK